MRPGNNASAIRDDVLDIHFEDAETVSSRPTLLETDGFRRGVVSGHMVEIALNLGPALDLSFFQVREMFYVIPGLHCPMLMGTDILVRQQVQLDFRQRHFDLELIGG